MVTGNVKINSTAITSSTKFYQYRGLFILLCWISGSSQAFHIVNYTLLLVEILLLKYQLTQLWGYDVFVHHHDVLIVNWLREAARYKYIQDIWTCNRSTCMRRVNVYILYEAVTHNQKLITNIDKEIFPLNESFAHCRMSRKSHKINVSSVLYA